MHTRKWPVDELKPHNFGPFYSRYLPKMHTQNVVVLPFCTCFIVLMYKCCRYQMAKTIDKLFTLSHTQHYKLTFGKHLKTPSRYLRPECHIRSRFRTTNSSRRKLAKQVCNQQLNSIRHTELINTLIGRRYVEQNITIRASLILQNINNAWSYLRSISSCTDKVIRCRANELIF